MSQEYIPTNHFSAGTSVQEIKDLVNTTSSHRHSSTEVHLPYEDNIDREIGGELKQKPLRFNTDRRKAIEAYGFN